MIATNSTAVSWANAVRAVAPASRAEVTTSDRQLPSRSTRVPNPTDRAATTIVAQKLICPNAVRVSSNSFSSGSVMTPRP